MASDEDEALLARARASDVEAIKELWDAHYPAALKLARGFTRQPADAEDIAADAFSRVIALVKAGAGPKDAFRMYLNTAVRSIAIDRSRARRSQDVVTDEIEDYERPAAMARDPVHDAAESAYVRAAFDSLPPRWQAVLWLTAVDHERLSTVAARLGVTPNAVAALAKRAREALRVAYLNAHLQGGRTAARCAVFVPGLAALVRGAPRRHGASSAALGAHLHECADCRARLAELHQINRDLARAVGSVRRTGWERPAAEDHRADSDPDGDGESAS